MTPYLHPEHFSRKDCYVAPRAELLHFESEHTFALSNIEPIHEENGMYGWN